MIDRLTEPRLVLEPGAPDGVNFFKFDGVLCSETGETEAMARIVVHQDVELAAMRGNHLVAPVPSRGPLLYR